jgi:hypothetical protein
MEGAVDKVIEALKPIADKLGEGAEFLYSVFYRQTIVEGTIQVVFPTIVSIAVTIAVWKGLKYALKRQKERAAYLSSRRSYEENGWTANVAIIIVGYVAVLAVSTSVIIDEQHQLTSESTETTFTPKLALKAGKPAVQEDSMLIENWRDLLEPRAEESLGEERKLKPDNQLQLPIESTSVVGKSPKLSQSHT